MLDLHVRVALGPGSHVRFKEVALSQTVRLFDEGRLLLGKIRV